MFFFHNTLDIIEPTGLARLLSASGAIEPASLASPESPIPIAIASLLSWPVPAHTRLMRHRKILGRGRIPHGGGEGVKHICWSFSPRDSTSLIAPP